MAPPHRHKKGRHEWLIEFIIPPQNIKTFASDLDQTLRSLNSDYDAKRSADLVMEKLRIHQIPEGTFEKWMRSENKYGGQNKIPRLKNDRSFLDTILKFKNRAFI